MNAEPGVFAIPEHITRASAAVREEGIYLIHGVYPAKDCASLREWMDVASQQPGVEVNYGGSEVRVWNSERSQAVIAEYTRQCDLFLSGMLGRPQKSYTTLSIRNRPANLTEASNVMGRWHIDSFRQQYKVFLFLSDVNDATGPFELIPGTQEWGFKLKMAATGRYFGIRGATRGYRPYSRIDDAVIDGLFARGFRSSAALCEAGTIMIVNTSAIHRARPCQSAPRYALTTYYR